MPPSDARGALIAEQAARWPEANGADRASTDERHRLVLVHPTFDGFITLHVSAHTDLDAVFVLPERSLEHVVTAHHRTGPLLRGQGLPIDLELHPGRLGGGRRPRADGLLELVDAEGEQIAAPVRMSVVVSRSVECVLAGTVDGPLEPRVFARTVDQLLAGRGSTRLVARQIARRS